MIPIKRLAEQAPSVLSKETKGKTESARAQAKFQAFIEERRNLMALPPADDERTLPRFKFNFVRYREYEVRRRLEDMFHGKCAYCEQRYGALHPMDVEHWRPKARVEYGEEHGDRDTGYWFLASDWNNLLPSCIDCNRARKQLVLDTGERTMMGKGNQFPLESGSVPAINGDDETIEERKSAVDQERPLLLNPCEDGFRPRDHFEYTDGIISGKTERAKASILVYALNRPELVHERQAVAHIFNHRVKVLTDIATLVRRERQSGDEHRLDRSRTMVEQMHDGVRSELFGMANPKRPFSGMIKFMLRDIAHQLSQPAD